MEPVNQQDTLADTSMLFMLSKIWILIIGIRLVEIYFSFNHTYSLFRKKIMSFLYMNSFVNSRRLLVNTLTNIKHNKGTHKQTKKGDNDRQTDIQRAIKR